MDYLLSYLESAEQGSRAPERLEDNLEIICLISHWEHWLWSHIRTVPAGGF